MKNNSPTLRQDAPAENKPKVTVSGLISLIVAILIFSGVFKGMGNFLAAFDYTTLAGAFGTIGEGGQNYLGSGATAPATASCSPSRSCPTSCWPSAW